MTNKASHHYQLLRDKLNETHKELQSMPEQYKLGYYHSVPSVLNAYREADISFDDACKILRDLTENDTAARP